MASPLHIARVMIELVMPYLKKNKLKANETKLTPELLCKFIDTIDWSKK